MDTRKCNGENADMDGKCIIYVFSGTGNTLAVAREYRTALSIETKISGIDETSESFPSPDDYDLVGIGYPVHAFNAPPAVRRFCRKLRSNTSRPLFIFHTGGESDQIPQGLFSYSILAEKDCRLTIRHRLPSGEYSIEMVSESYQSSTM